MRNPFNFEAEPFEFDSEFDEYQEGQSSEPCPCHRRSRNGAEFSEEYQEEQPDTYSEFDEEYESDFEGEPFEIYSEFDGAELYDEYSDPESSEVWRLKRRPKKRRPQQPPTPACALFIDGSLTYLRTSLDGLSTALKKKSPQDIKTWRNEVFTAVKGILKNSRDGEFMCKGCTKQDLRDLAKKVSKLSWPQTSGWRKTRKKVINSILRAARRRCPR